MTTPHKAREIAGWFDRIGSGNSLRITQGEWWLKQDGISREFALMTRDALCSLADQIEALEKWQPVIDAARQWHVSREAWLASIGEGSEYDNRNRHESSGDFLWEKIREALK